MTLLSEYYVPGLHIEDRSIKVPLDWTGHEPGHGFDGESISLFYRVVTAPEHVHDDLPLLVFLQGGPGGSGPRPLGPSSDGWIEEAIKLAVTNNVRRWRYVQSILERWRVEGRKDALGQRDTQRNLQRQIPSEYDDIIKR